MPGGAPLRKRAKRKKSAAPAERPCKYGPRDEEGYCPKKPKAAKRGSSGSSRAKKKPPCKYGPRDADGYCPKKSNAKPRSNAPAYKKVEYAARTVSNPKATRSEKSEALRAAGTAVAVDAGKSVARDARRALQKRGVKQKAVAAVKKYAPVALGVAKRAAIPVAIATGTLYAGGKALTANREREAQAFAKRELANTEKRLKRKLTAQERSTLQRQYVEYARKKPVTNSFSGK